jgi:hypothetical protein
MRATFSDEKTTMISLPGMKTFSISGLGGWRAANTPIPR